MLASRTSSTPIKVTSYQPGVQRVPERAVLLERLWRSVKYEEVCLHAHETINAAQQGLERSLTFYKQIRPHRALDGRTPD